MRSSNILIWYRSWWKQVSKPVLGRNGESKTDRSQSYRGWLAGACGIYGGPVIVIDFGTATTYDLIDKDGAFLAGIMAPGIRISAKALWRMSAKLPQIEIKKPEKHPCKETISSMQAGLVYGKIPVETEYIIRKIKEEANMDEPIKVVATGGLGALSHRKQMRSML